jgi:hypothetical protein
VERENRIQMADRVVEKRRTPRTSLEIPVAVKSHTADGVAWHEWALTKDLSVGGLSLDLRPAVTPGQVLFLELPLPQPFRPPDSAGAMCSLYGLVRNVRETSEAARRVGVQLLGPQPPRGFERHPGALFLLADDEPPPVPSGRADADPWERRESARFRVLMNLVLRKLDAAGRVEREELTVTEDVGRDGLRLKTTLAVQPGDVLVVRDPASGFESSVGVCDSWVADDGVRRLNLKFLGGGTGRALIGE